MVSLFCIESFLTPNVLKCNQCFVRRPSRSIEIKKAKKKLFRNGKLSRANLGLRDLSNFGY